MDFILSAVIVLGGIALIAAVILYVCSKKFAVKEDPRLSLVAEQLPGANCGGCGFPGCSGLASALVKGADAGSIDGLSCPVGGAEVMTKVADLLGMAMANSEPKVAVVKEPKVKEEKAPKEPKVKEEKAPKVKEEKTSKAKAEKVPAQRATKEEQERAKEAKKQRDVKVSVRRKRDMKGDDEEENEEN